MSQLLKSSIPGIPLGMPQTDILTFLVGLSIKSKEELIIHNLEPKLVELEF